MTLTAGKGVELVDVPLAGREDGLGGRRRADSPGRPARRRLSSRACPNYLGCIDPLSPAKEAANQAGALAGRCLRPCGRRPAANARGARGGRGRGRGPADWVRRWLSVGRTLACSPWLASTSVVFRGAWSAGPWTASGRTAYVTTLRAREQDIRRERAASNICTNETLIAVAAMVQLAWLGTHGLRELALRCARGARYAREAVLAVPGVEPFAAAPVVYEFALKLPLPAEVVVERMAEEGFLAGLPVEVGGQSGSAGGRNGEAHPGRHRRLRRRHGKGGLMTTPATSATALHGLDQCLTSTPRTGTPRTGTPVDWPPMQLAAAPGGRAASAPLIGHEEEPTIFDFSVPGRRAASFRTTGVPEWTAEELVPLEDLRPEPPAVAEISERDLVGHMTRLSHRQYSVDLGAYPLGSCTMKYNPKLCDEAAALPGLSQVHPATPAAYAQGWLELLWRLSDALCRVTGMHAATLQPPAGASGELTGLLLIRAWHREHGPFSPSKVTDPGLGPWDQPGVGQPGRVRHRERAVRQSWPGEHAPSCAGTSMTT